jgi:hypothetical protein
MTNWTSVGIGAVITAGLTIVLALVFFPLFFIGPIIGGFVTVYLIRDEFWEFESGTVNGALTGVVAGLIIGILSLLGIGVIAGVVALLLAKLGIIIGLAGVLLVVLITILAVIILGVLAAIGGAIGEYVRDSADRGYVDYADD